MGIIITWDQVQEFKERRHQEIMKEINVLKAAGIVEEITTGAGETLYTLADSTKDIVAAYARERR